MTKIRETELFTNKIKFIMDAYNDKVAVLFRAEKEHSLDDRDSIARRIYIDDFEYQLKCALIILMREMVEQEVIKYAKMDAIALNEKNKNTSMKRVISFYGRYDIRVNYEELRILSNAIKHANGAYKELKEKYSKYIKTLKTCSTIWADIDQVELYDNTIINSTINLDEKVIERLGKSAIKAIKELNEQRYSIIYS